MPRRSRRVQSVAAMSAPIFVPARSIAALQHRAGQIARSRRGAEGGGAVAAGPAARDAAHNRPANEDMARPVPPLRFPEQTDEMIACGDRVGIRTGMPRTAAAVHFARGDPGKADMRTLGAPDRSIAIPDRDGCAGEGLAGRDDRGEQEQAEHRPCRNPDGCPIQTPQRSQSIIEPREAPKDKRALGEAAVGRRARGPVGQPPSGKDTEPSALRGPIQRAAPGAARRRQSTPNSAALDLPAALVQSSALMTNDGPRLAAQAARSLRALESAHTAGRTRRNAGLRQRRKVEPVRDAFVAERCPFHSPDERLDTFCNG